MNFSIYTPRQEENIFIRKQAGTWFRSGLITSSQLGTINAATEPHLQQTNSFFRILFFFFTLLCAGALVGLSIWMISQGKKTDEIMLAVMLIFFSAVYYIVAEYVTGKRRFYRYGIEEALVLISLLLFCGGCSLLLFKSGFNYRETIMAVSALAAIAALLIYLRFGFLYAALISLIAVCVIPFQLSLSLQNERIALLIIFCLVFFWNTTCDKLQSEDFRKERNAMIQAGLLLGIYFTVNLQIASLMSLITGSGIIPSSPRLFSPCIYWSSCVLTFAVPVLGIYQGIKNRKRLILNTSLILACLTLATNKSYLGLVRYAWDPAILGIMLIAVSLIISRWLARGANGMRFGFTGKDILQTENNGIGLAAAAAAYTPSFIDAQQSPAQPGNYSGGGSSGGGGAARDF